MGAEVGRGAADFFFFFFSVSTGKPVGEKIYKNYTEFYWMCLIGSFYNIKLIKVMAI